MGGAASGERRLRARRLPRRRGEGPLVRPGDRRVAGDVPRAEGQGSLYWLGHRDAAGDYLDGARPYRLTVPLPVPATFFWSVTCYDAQTRSEIQAAQDRAALRSLFDDLTAGGADSIDLYFGPEEPPGARDRWIQTVPGRGWFCYFRIYGPKQAAFDNTWKPGDITAA
ncbi:DUF1214 domain-containing protein [Pseudofrankia asymbiotica]|uniref:DUF1214 domain-containing protein n=1 Tax=Pseudofrankia asymbiotica TaxID=1834516 RepID=UPI003B75B71A